jgi:hypothetical protein
MNVRPLEMLLLKNLADRFRGQNNLLSTSSSKSSAALQRASHSERALSLEVPSHTVKFSVTSCQGAASGVAGINPFQLWASAKASFRAQSRQ